VADRSTHRGAAGVGAPSLVGAPTAHVTAARSALLRGIGARGSRRRRSRDTIVGVAVGVAHDSL
jgi:hypothetical protein